MSRLAEFRKLEETLAAQLAELEAMKSTPELQTEIEFEKKLRSLLEQYGYSLRNIIDILDPAAGRRGVATAANQGQKQQRKAREMKVYTNPHSGEVVETKGGNHKLLKQWKAEHGAEEVESWLKN